ncbi:MAG: glycosyltransferase [Lentisphaeraceae bacterium]|nr:glycosyltransferase [Lentisphaeraceae bacterium]
MSRIKVLQISHDYEPPFLDVANFYSELFDKEKYEVTSLFLKGSPIENPSKVVKGERIIFFNYDTRNLKGLKIGLIKKIRALINEEQYSIVIAQRYKAIYLVGMAGLQTHNFTFIGVIHAYNVFKNFTRKILLKKIKDKIILLGVSRAIKKDILNHVKPIEFFKVYSLPNCLPEREFCSALLSRSEARAKLSIPDDAFVFGSAGRLHPDKDQETLIRAFAQITDDMPNSLLYIMGYGKLEKEIRKLIKSLNLENKVFLLGMVKNGPRYFKAFDLFVLPSKLEPFGMVLIEAMAAEVPLISSKTGGAIEVIANEDQLFEIGNADECAKLMRIFYNMPSELREKIVESAKFRFKKLFTQEAFRKKFWSIVPISKIE